jgi:TatD DNase family protein
MKPLLIDSHAHLDDPSFHSDLAEVIERAADAGVTRIISIGAGGGDSEKNKDGLGSARSIVSIIDRFPNVYATVGVHPHDAAKAIEFGNYYSTLKDLATHPKVVAIGEIGLDLFRDWAPIEMQRQVFRSLIELALEVGKPVIIHSRNAADSNNIAKECYETLVSYGAQKIGGVFHCFSESAEFAQALREINFRVSFPGSLTFRKANELRQVAAAIPLDQILVETDAPYMAPEPYRGKRCESMFVSEIALVLSELKRISYAECCETLTSNTEKLFPAISG